MTYPFDALAQRKRLGILCWCAVIAVLVATLWPFDFQAINKIRWLPNSAGLRFDGEGIVLSIASLPPAVATSGNSCSLELLMRPSSIKTTGIFFSIYDKKTRSEFVLDQKMNRLLISRAVSTGLDEVNLREPDEKHTFEAGSLLLVTVTSGPDGMNVYWNGGQPQRFPGFTMMPCVSASQIALGSSTLFFSTYWGEIHGLAIYPKELGTDEILRDFHIWTSEDAFDPSQLPAATAVYGFREGMGSRIRNLVGSAPDLQIPEHFVMPQKPFLESPAREFKATWSYARSMADNILGFVPLGLIFCAYFAFTRSVRRAIVYATFAGGTLSFVIEVLQYYVPSRGSGITDIITNTTGAALGALLVLLWRSKQGKQA